jgi:DNA-binding XRE family transcriptional regulator
MSVCDPTWKRALLEGVPAPGLAAHIATCEGCRTLRARIDVIQRLAADLPVPPVPARLVARLGQEHALVVSRGEIAAPVRHAQPQAGARPHHAGLEASEENAPGQVGDLLRGYRAAARLTQEELAALTGLSLDAVGALERGLRRAPRRSTVLALADALQLDRRQREALLRAFHDDGSESGGGPPRPAAPSVD